MANSLEDDLCTRMLHTIKEYERTQRKRRQVRKHRHCLTILAHSLLSRECGAYRKIVLDITNICGWNSHYMPNQLFVCLNSFQYD